MTSDVRVIVHGMDSCTKLANVIFASEYYTRLVQSHFVYTHKTYK